MGGFRAGIFAAGVLILSGAMAMPASAQSLTDALISAYRNSTQLEIARAGLRSTDEGVAQAYASYRPSVSVSASSTGSYLVPALGANYTTYRNSLSLSASLTVWDGGATKQAVEVARLAVEAGRANLTAAEQGVLLDAVTAFMDMHRDMQSLALAENNQEVLARQVQAAKDRFEVGEVRHTDVSLAEAAYAGAQAAVAIAQGALEISRENYKLAVGLYPGQIKAPPPLPRYPGTMAAATTIALKTHPAIAAAQQQVKIAELNVARAETALKPKITLSGSLGANPATGINNSATISLGTSATIYAGGAYTSAYRQALALKDQSKANLVLTSKSVAQAVAITWSRIEIAQASIVAKAKQVRASRVALQGIREEANLGALTTLDILNAEQDLVQAESNLTTAEHDHYVAVYSLLSAMGLLTVKHLNLGIKTYDTNENYNRVSTAPGPTKEDKLLQKIFSRAGKN